MKQNKCVDNSKFMYIALIFIVAVIFGSVVYVFAPPVNFYERYENASKYNIEYFYMETCPHCVDFTPIWEKVSKKSEFANTKFVKYEISKNRERSNKFNITSAPTVVAVDKKNDVVIASFTDARTEESLSKFISKYI